MSITIFLESFSRLYDLEHTVDSIEHHSIQVWYTNFGNSSCGDHDLDKVMRLVITEAPTDEHELTGAGSATTRLSRQ